MNQKAKDLSLEAVESTIKGILGAVPFAGTALNEALFDCRSRIKQKRLNHFISEFTEYLSGVTEEEFDFEYIKSEEFGDVFESIVRRVMNNGSEDKLNRFKKILANHVLGEFKTDHTETFLDIVSRINEEQVKILEVHRKIKNKDIDLCEDLPEKNVIDANFESRLSELRKANYFSLDTGVFQFYLQDLFAKGLLFDDGVNRMDLGPFELMEITQFGLDVLLFIEKGRP